MDYGKFLERIGMCQGGVSVFNDLHQRTDEETLERAYQAFDAGDEAFQSFLGAFAAEKGVSPEEANLYLYIRMLDRTYDFYQTKGISDDIFYATMKYFAAACNGCYIKDGYYGIRQVTFRAWYRRHLNGTIFDIGRLEFEIVDSPYDFDLDGYHISKGDTCIYIHIPGGTPLDFDACQDAYANAREFFKKYFQLDPVIFYCGSWLLHPWLSEVLPETSRIVKFQKQFRLAEVGQSEQEIRNWLFDHSDAPYDELPVKTSLHKAAVHRLKNGLPIGYARGFHF